MSVSACGLVVSPTEMSDGVVVFAELMPAPPLRLRKSRGRAWREAHIRWWFEVHSTEVKTSENPEGYPTHWWRCDGGGVTLRGTIAKAVEAVDRVCSERIPAGRGP